MFILIGMLNFQIAQLLSCLQDSVLFCILFAKSRILPLHGQMFKFAVKITGRQKNRHVIGAAELYV